MAVFRGHNRHFNKLIYIIAIFVALWWLQVISIGNPYDAPCPCGHKLPISAGQSAHGNGMEGWKPEVSDIRHEGDPVRKDVHKQVSTLNPHEAIKNDGKCTEKINFVYIKEIKCASQTLVNIFRRFGLERRLSIVTPIGKKLYLGWPWLLKDTYHRPSKTGEFNILCDHTVFEEEIFRSLMPSDVLYITSLREPFSQFKSMFNYYGFPRIINITAKNPLAEYLTHQDHYESIYISNQVTKARYCIPEGFHMSKNLMAYNMGFPTGFLPGKPDMSEDPEFIKEWIAYVDKIFNMVIIVEYFHESMVLLKRKLCWDMRDIVYFAQNVGSYAYRSEHNQTLVDIYKKWSSVDYTLYDHFNKSFWLQVSKEDSADFFQEVNQYQNVIKDIHFYCDNVKNGKTDKGTFITVYGTKWNKPFDVDEQFCTKLAIDHLEGVQRYWDFTYPQMEQPKPDREFC